MRTLFNRSALLASACFVVGVTAAAAGSGVGGVFNLGQTNTVDARTVLTGTLPAALLTTNNPSPSGDAVGLAATAARGTGLVAISNVRGIKSYALNTTGLTYGVYATVASPDGFGGFFQNTSTGAYKGIAVRGLAAGGTETNIHPGGSFWQAAGEFSGLNGVIGAASPAVSDGYGVIGLASGSIGVGVYARGTGGSKALVASGDVDVLGTLTKSAGSFRIDHPLDPENKYLSHSFVESPDMKNVYDGIITTDAKGEAVVQLPDYFDALNRDPRYQLTVIGSFADAQISRKESGNSFAVRTEEPGIEVSWQVTGIRRDAYAVQHPIVVEEDKLLADRGKYLVPEVFGMPASLGIGWREKAGLPRQARADTPVTGAGVR